MKDDYTLVCRLLAGGLIVVSIGWLLDHGPALRQAWKDYRQRSADLRLARTLNRVNNFGVFSKEFHDIKIELTRWQKKIADEPRPAGTVQNPSDPSPTPHVQRFGSKFPR